MSTVRITNIHPEATRDDLVNLFISHQLQSDVVFVESADGTKTVVLPHFRVERGRTETV
jgi:hypothetical protein